MFPPAETPTASFPYRIEGRIGEGAMGIVYRAVEADLERTVAIKALRMEMLREKEPAVVEEARKRFLQEARAAAALSHTGVTTIYRVGEEGGVPYMAMEWLDGEPLDRVIQHHGPFEVERAARIGVDLLETLEVAHRAGVVHRDIKPSNLLLLASGRLKVTDFGIARVQGSELIQTQAGLVLATPKFASPEQLKAEDVDGRCDLFSTAVVLYFLLSAKYPFEGDTFMEVASAILRKDPVPLREYVPGLPPAMEAALDRAFSKDREQRFGTASEMARALAPFARPAESSPGLGRTGIAPVDTAQLPAAGEPPLTELPRDPLEMVVAVVGGWPAKELGRQETAALLGRLQERPLHAPPFAGAVFLGSTCVLLEAGIILGAVDLASNLDPTGDALLEALPERTEARLHPVPGSLPSGVVRVLASLLGPPEVTHANLDSSFVHLPALAERLATEELDGLMRLERGEGVGLLLFCRGRLVRSLFSTGWTEVDVTRPWESWVSEVPVRASVEEATVCPSIVSLRQSLADLEVEVRQVDTADQALEKPVDRTSTALRMLRQTGTGTVRADISFRLTPSLDGTALEGDGSPIAMPSRDTVYRFLGWALESLPGYFLERDRASRWKYLVTWLYLVRQAKLHHRLKRPGSGAVDFFDLVTFDEGGKVMHLAQRAARVTADAFQDFRERVVAAKSARKKTGDVGGAFLVSPRFDPEALEAYKEATRPEKSSGWFGVEETFTGYEGFVRIGPRRGFHLLLVEETADGFKPILPG